MKFITENKALLDAIKSWLSVIGVFCAAIYSVIEYVEHKHSVRLERSLDYVENYREGSVADAKLSLNLLLQNNQAQLISILEHDTEKGILHKKYSGFILKMTSEPEPQRNLEITFSFFEEMAVCVEKELCDEEIILSFFNNDARSLFNAYYPYVCSLRQEWKNPAVYLKLENFYIRSGKDICSP